MKSYIIRQDQADEKRREIWRSCFQSADKCVREGRDIEITTKYAEGKRSVEQNAKLHCILTDIANQVVWHGQRLSIVKWKRLTMAAFLREEGEQPELIPALDGNGFDIIFERTSKLGVKKCAKLIEWCYAFGEENEVKWSDPIPSEYMREDEINVSSSPLSVDAEKLCIDKQFGPWFKSTNNAAYIACVNSFGPAKWNKFTSVNKCRELILYACSINSRSELDSDDLAANTFREHIAEPFSSYKNDLTPNVGNFDGYGD
jgi:hypothetical protein